MSENSKPNYYAVIIAPVRYCRDLEPNAKLLYGEISALCNQEGYCWASNKYFSELYDVDERTIKRWLESLKDKDFIKVEIDRKGLQVSRKIYISQINFTKGQNCHDEGTKMSPRGDKNVPYNNTSNNTSNKNNIRADKVDAKPPKKSKSEIQRKERRSNVHTSDEEHEKLLKKCGSQEILDKCYDNLSDWKSSKSESDPKSVDKHIDYYRIIKWVLAETLSSSPNKNSKTSQAEYNRSVVSKVFKHGQIYNGAECFLNEESIGFQRGMTHMSVKFKELGFKDQYLSMCRKFGITFKKE